MDAKHLVALSVYYDDFQTGRREAHLGRGRCLLSFSQTCLVDWDGLRLPTNPSSGVRVLW